MGLDSTYEGLKRKMIRCPVKVLGCLDSTYEGLKLLGDRVDDDLTCRLDSTYEGLKPDAGGVDVAAAAAFGQYL